MAQGGEAGWPKSLKEEDEPVIPRLVDQDPWAQLRRPMDMIRQG
jgi:hypothetical protein